MDRLRGIGVFGIAIGFLTTALIALAIVQYRWITRVADVERQEQTERAEEFAGHLAAAVSEELMRAFDAFAAPERQSVVSIHEQWRRGAANPNLIETVFVAERFGTEWQLHRLDRKTQALEPVDWPPQLEVVRQAVVALKERGPNPKWPSALFARTPGLFIVQRPAEQKPEFIFGVPLRVIFLQLSTAGLQQTMHAEVSRRHPRTPFDYALAASGHVLVRSTPGWPGEGVREDASAVVPSVRIAIRPYDPDLSVQGEWTVLVHRAGGGVGAVANAAHYRNLAVSGVILLILATSVLVLLGLMRRVQRLRAQQAAFVTMMTHELNTPVAVLRGAGENLRDGIVSGSEQVCAYGAAIVSEADRLRRLTEDIVDVAGLRPRAAQRPTHAVAIADLVQATVDRCRLLTNDRPLEIEIDIDGDLPPVQGDEASLSRAVENLVTNAIRHASAGGWIGVHARPHAGGVAITVEDRGPGIAPADAAHLFEPFHRGSAAEFIEGAGLGLAIVRQIAAAHGGSVVFEPQAKGAVFTLHLPGAPVG